MLVWKIVLLALGAAFLLFGFLFFFRKQYSLINDFEAERKAGRKGEQYARRVGLTEFILGIILLLAGIALVLFA